MTEAAAAGVISTGHGLTTTRTIEVQIMAGKNSTRPKRAGSRKPTNPPVVVPTARGIPTKTEGVIRGEIRRLQKALAVLTCLREVALYEVEVDYADVAAVACDLVDKALYELDRVGLRGETGI